MIPCQRPLFDIPDDVTYLNCAYMAPLMKSVAAAGRAGVDRKLHPWEIQSKHFFTEVDALRALASKLFHCRSDDVAIVPAASYGLATAAANIPVAKGKTILVMEDEFPSTFYTSARIAQEKGATIVTVPRPDDGDWTSAVLQRLDATVAIAALPHVHWSTGGLLDLVAIGAACRRHDIALMMDLTQSLGAIPFDVQAVQPDFAVAATYKWLLGPYSMGVLYVAPRWQQGRPLEEGWAPRKKAQEFSRVDYYDDYASGARRFDVGERSNFALVGAATKAIEQLLVWGVGEISETLRTLNQQLVDALTPLGFSAPPERWRAPHYLCLTSDHVDSATLGASLAERRIYVSVRGDAIRVTPHIYNSADDLHRFVEAVTEIVSRPKGRARQGDALKRAVL